MKTFFLLLCFLGLSIAPSFAQESIEQTLRFAKGKNSGTVRGEVKDSETYYAYSLGAKRGQRMQVRLAAPNPKVFFNVFTPDGDTLLYDARGIKTVDLEGNGTYRITVVGNEGIKGSGKFTLTVTIL